jgi:hypothetical protein
MNSPTFYCALHERDGNLKPNELEIYQLKYLIIAAANQDINVISIERLQELAQEGIISSLTEKFFSFIGKHYGNRST